MVARYEVTDADGAWQVFTPGQPPQRFPTREAALSWIHQQGGGPHTDAPVTALDPEPRGKGRAADAEPYLPPEQASPTTDPGTSAGDELTTGMDPHPAPGGLKAPLEGGG
jgi:hypothetical protein